MRLSKQVFLDDELSDGAKAIYGTVKAMQGGENIAVSASNIADMSTMDKQTVTGYLNELVNHKYLNTYRSVPSIPHKEVGYY